MHSVIKSYLMTCPTCNLSTHDEALMERHSCDVQENGGRCEDYPCCGHEFGDCNGELYGSDEAIKEQAMADIYAEADYDDGGYEDDYS